MVYRDRCLDKEAFDANGLVPDCTFPLFLAIVDGHLFTLSFWIIPSLARIDDCAPSLGLFRPCTRILLFDHRRSSGSIDAEMSQWITWISPTHCRPFGIFRSFATQPGVMKPRCFGLPRPMAGEMDPGFGPLLPWARLWRSWMVILFCCCFAVWF